MNKVNEIELSFNPAVYAIFISFVVCIILCLLFIPYLKKLNFGQHVRNDGPESHLSKAGTPTAGGIIIILSFITVSLLFLRGNTVGAALVLVALSCGLLGFLDDYISIKKKRSLGLRAYQKIIGMIFISVSFILFLMNTPGFSTDIMIPFMRETSFDLGILYLPFVCFIFLGTVNGSNFTDGIDGFNSGVTLLITVFFLFAAWMLGNPIFPITGAVAGSLLGFLIFNSYPAKIFMGDTGSLALGGFVAASAIILGMPLWLMIVALVYVIEVLSVIIQVGYFKLTGGKRVFKMAPIHHSFELSGWHETKIVVFCCILTAILCLIGYLAM